MLNLVIILLKTQVNKTVVLNIILVTKYLLVKLIFYDAGQRFATVTFM